MLTLIVEDQTHCMFTHFGGANGRETKICSLSCS